MHLAHSLFMRQLKVVCVAYAGIKKNMIKKHQKFRRMAQIRDFEILALLPILAWKSGGHCDRRYRTVASLPTAWH